MYIKQLELNNFKSFKNIVIPFTEGLTVITGPNASGKSNILDSINFVYGKIENDLHFFNSDSLKLKVKIVFDNGISIEKISEKDYIFQMADYHEKYFVQSGTKNR